MPKQSNAAHKLAASPGNANCKIDRPRSFIEPLPKIPNTGEKALPAESTLFFRLTEDFDGEFAQFLGAGCSRTDWTLLIRFRILPATNQPIRAGNDEERQAHPCDRTGSSFGGLAWLVLC